MSRVRQVRIRRVVLRGGPIDHHDLTRLPGLLAARMDAAVASEAPSSVRDVRDVAALVAGRVTGEVRRGRGS